MKARTRRVRARARTEVRRPREERIYGDTPEREVYLEPDPKSILNPSPSPPPRRKRTTWEFIGINNKRIFPSNIISAREIYTFLCTAAFAS